MSKRLIVFTRYPEPGSSKTRLIPALGREGAAILHRQMAEHMLHQIRELQRTYPVQVEVQFTGGDRYQMQSWLGNDLDYAPQAEGDLGDRMAQALQTAFTSGSRRVVVIGTDCPDLDALLLKQAFDQLYQHDIVLGPATDGGYYLIGMNCLIPQLFKGITWSTSEVLSQTVAIAQSLHLAIAYLPTLSDVDYPEDLVIWDRQRDTR